MAIFLGTSWGTISGPFGDSHDGRNAGVWASGARSIRDHGTIESRLGAWSADRGVYANHPPLLYVQTAVADFVGRDWNVATRAPAWLGSVVALFLLAQLLRERGLRPSAVGGAVVLVAASPMFLVYGTMLDTPVTSLPFALGLLLLWERTRDGIVGPPSGLFALAALAVLAGWQSLLVAAGVGVWAMVRVILRRGPKQLNLTVVSGVVCGVVVLALWQLWAYGWSLQPVLDQFQVRTGQTAAASSSFGDLLARQYRDVSHMFGLPLLVLGVAGLVLAVADRRTRALAAIGTIVTISYVVVFRNGALAHDYWDYWLLWPLAVGLGVGLDRLARALPPRRGKEVGFAAGTALIALVATVGLLLNPPTARRFLDRGLPAGRLADEARLGPAQETAWYAGVVVDPASWLSLATSRPAVLVPDDFLRDLAAARPSDQVLVGHVTCDDGRTRTHYAFEQAAVLAHRPPQADPCP